MSTESKTIANLKGQLSKFSGIISNDFRKPKQRLIKEMLYGIQASKDVGGHAVAMQCEPIWGQTNTTIWGQFFPAC